MKPAIFENEVLGRKIGVHQNEQHPLLRWKVAVEFNHFAIYALDSSRPAGAVEILLAQGDSRARLEEDVSDAAAVDDFDCACAALPANLRAVMVVEVIVIVHRRFAIYHFPETKRLRHVVRICRRSDRILLAGLWANIEIDKLPVFLRTARLHAKAFACPEINVPQCKVLV